jgi:beta-xylosidase
MFIFFESGETLWELGFMPSALASGDKTIFWWKGNVTPPKDYKKWGELIRQLTLHFTERYGAAEVKTWYFEVWNEPNLTPWFWTGTQQEYFTLYEYSVAAKTKAGAAWVPETIQYRRKNPADFISTHTYGVKQGFWMNTTRAPSSIKPDERERLSELTEQIAASFHARTRTALYRMEFLLHPV